MVKPGVKVIGAFVCGIFLFFGGDSVSAVRTDYNVNINASLNITLSSPSVTLNLLPKDTPVFGSENLSTTVSTNNLTGYNLSVSATGTNLVNGSDNTKTIPTLPTQAGGYTESDFVTNKWGYKIGNGNYLPFVSGTPLSSSNAPVNADTTNLTFAAKIDSTQVPGVYSIALNFTAVANPVPTFMQNLDASSCTSTPSLVVDNRDNQEYTIQRLADGNCWMMTNLNLGADGDLTQDLNRYNTNVHDTVSATTFNSWKKTTGTGTYTAGEFIPISGTDSTANAPYGTLYNYYAASAGTISGDSNSQNATYDICPAGWRLPTGGSGGEFEALYNNTAYNTYAKMHAPISEGGAAFALAGYFTTGAPANQGSQSIYWSSTRVGNTDMYTLSIRSSSGVIANDYYRRSYGFPIRCVLKSSIDTVDTMQQFASLNTKQKSDVLDSMKVGEVYDLSDGRDNEDYKVAKLADGRVWMLDNLRLGGSTTVNLTPADTNISSNWTLPASGTTCFYSSSCTGSDGSTTGTGYTVPAIYANYKDTLAATRYGEGSGKRGVYYNYCAASAGTYCYASGSGTGNAEHDICPAGWRMFTGGSTGEYGTLYSAYDENATAFKNALSTPISGYVYNTSPTVNTSYGRFWSSSYSSANNMYGLYVGTSTLNFTNAPARYYGNSVRCILK